MISKINWKIYKAGFFISILLFLSKVTEGYSFQSNSLPESVCHFNSDFNSDNFLIPFVDTIPPIITLKGNLIIIWPRWKPYIDPGAIVTDDQDSNISCVTDISGVNYFLDGVYLVKFDVSDRSGNKAKQVLRYVMIRSQEGEQHDGISNEMDKPSFNIYPNPNHGLINIECNLESPDGVNVFIYSSDGKMVYSKEKCCFSGNKFQIDFRDGLPGQYLVMLSAGNKIATKTFSILK